MIAFVLERNGVPMAEGVEFSDFTIALRWLGNTASTAVFASIEDVEAVHFTMNVVWPEDEEDDCSDCSCSACEMRQPMQVVPLSLDRHAEIRYLRERLETETQALAARVSRVEEVYGLLLGDPEPQGETCRLIATEGMPLCEGEDSCFEQGRCLGPKNLRRPWAGD